MPFGKIPPGVPHAGSAPPSRPMSSAGVSTGDEDETDDFDWDTSADDGDSDDPEGKNAEDKMIIGADGKKRLRARRGRAVYLACMRLARPVRIVLFALVGTAIALVPFIVVISAFPADPARAQVQVWSIWLAIIYAAACGTWLFVDWIPALLMKLAIAVYGRAPEVFKVSIRSSLQCSPFL